MSSLAKYLIPTERTEVEVRRHWASLVRPASIALGVAAVGALVIWFGGEVGFLAGLGALVILGALGWLAWMIGDWYVERFVITDKRVLLVSGLLTQRVAIMPLSKVTDLTYERTVWGRLFGFGVFIVESAGQHQALSRIDYLPSPDLLYHQVSELLFGRRSRRWYADDRLPPAARPRPWPPEDAAHAQTTPLPPVS
jgi:membrane protein YdbS with pleckstrin-like domain